MPFKDEFGQRFAATRFAMCKDELWLGMRERAEPLKQTGLPSVGAETIKSMDARVYLHHFSKNLHDLAGVHKLAPKGAFRLVTDDHDRSFRVGQSVVPMVKDATCVAHK